MKLDMTISGTTLNVSLEDNVATRALVDRLRQGPLTYTAADYGGFEKVGALGFSLPAVDEYQSAQPGDVMLYCGNQLVLFFGHNEWEYTRIGRLESGSARRLRDFLQAGRGSVAVTICLNIE